MTAAMLAWIGRLGGHAERYCDYSAKEVMNDVANNDAPAAGPLQIAGADQYDAMRETAPGVPSAIRPLQ